jgi:uncharacterized protein YbcC (UPF0753/DUF2309 family)
MNRLIKSTLYRYLDSLPESDISLWGITDLMQARTLFRVMPHTVKRYCKDYADAAGAGFTIKKQNESIYHFTPGLKIAGALGGKE